MGTQIIIQKRVAYQGGKGEGWGRWIADGRGGPPDVTHLDVGHVLVAVWVPFRLGVC